MEEKKEKSKHTEVAGGWGQGLDPSSSQEEADLYSSLLTSRLRISS